MSQTCYLFLSQLSKNVKSQLVGPESIANVSDLTVEKIIQISTVSHLFVCFSSFLFFFFLLNGRKIEMPYQISEIIWPFGFERNFDEAIEGWDRGMA